MESMPSHSQSRRLYSWWWNSHISPKNSKWLQENLADMDGKVKAMIRIIEEDADSFARRAEMYYKKRPELMKLVEEFYRAYRALAERYDNATGVLRQAHRTMAAVFPNHLSPEEFSDDAEPIGSDMLADELFDGAGGYDDAMEMSGDGGVFAQESDPESKLLREEIARLKDEFFEERTEKEDALLRYNESQTRISYLESEISRIQEDLGRLNDELLKEAASLTNSKEQILALETANRSLQLELEKLEISQEELGIAAEKLKEMELTKSSLEEELRKIREENQVLNEQKLSSTLKIIDLQDEIIFLRELKGKLQDEVKSCREEKELLYQELCRIKQDSNDLKEQIRDAIQTHESEKVLYLQNLERSERQFGESQEQLRGVHEKLKEYIERISVLQQDIICLKNLKEKLEDELQLHREEKETLHLELSQLKERHVLQEEQVQEVTTKMESLEATMKELRDRNDELDEAMKRQCSEHQEELKEMEVIRLSLEEKLEEIKQENSRLNEQNLSSTVRMINLQDEITCLRNLKRKLEDEMKDCVGEKEVLHLKMASLNSTIMELRARNDKLDESMKRQCSEYQEELKGMEEIKQENNRLNEQNLSSTVRMINLQDEIICLRNLKRKLEDEMKNCVGEREALHLQMESLTATIKELRDRNDELDEAIKKQRSESQEELREMKLIKSSLEEELEKIVQENSRLNEQNLSLTMKIITLQDEIIYLKNSKGRIEDEMRLCAGEKEALQLELCRLKEDTNNSEHRHQFLQQQIQAVTGEMESLQAMIQDLKSGNDELKDTIKRHERERALQSQNLKQIQAMTERNAILENSLSEANHELERLRDKIKAHEQSCEELRSRISLDQTEKAVLVSHMDAAARNIEKLLSKNSFLENSLYDVSEELESLKGSFRVLDESCRSLRGLKSSFLSEKDTLAAKVESISWSLKNLENSFTESEGKCSNLEREKASLLDQVAELQEFLKLEKEKHKALIHSSKNQLNALQDQISHLERQSSEMEEVLELEQQRVMNAQLEIFILRRCLRDIKEENLIHSAGLQEQQEALRSAERLVAELKQECLDQAKKIMRSARQREELREWILRILQTLEIDLKYVSSDDLKDEFLLQLILCEVRHLLNTISDAHDEKQILILEKSVVVTLLEQFGLYVGDLRAEVVALDRESKSKKEEFASLIDENNRILEKNKELNEKLQVGNQKEELLNSEMDLLFRQLSQLQESHRKLQMENSKLSKEKRFLSERLNVLRTKECRREEEMKSMLAEIMTLDYFSVALKSLAAERGLEITKMNKRVEGLELENKQLKVSFANLEECRRFLSRLDNDLNMAAKVMNVCEQLNQQTHTGEDHLLEKDSELRQAKKNTQGSQVANLEAKKELERTRSDVNRLRNKGENLIDDLQGSSNGEIKSSEAEVTLLLNDIQCATISATLFRQKVIELILTCESIERSAMLHRKVLDEEIKLKDASVVQLKEKVNALEMDNSRLKEELDAYMSLLGTFWDDISILEEQTLSLGKSNQSSPNKQGKQVNSKSQEEDQTYDPRSQAGILELQDLQIKIRGLQKLVRDTRSLLELERLDSNASIEAARKEIEALRSNDSRKVKYERIMRDIKLDVVLNSSKNTNNIHYHGERRKGNGNQTSDHKLELWGRTTTTPTTEGDSSSSQKQKSPLLIEEMEATHPSSDPVSEKELGVDKLEVPKEMESLLDWHQRITERLSPNAQRLLVLQTNVHETQKNVEAFEKNSNLTTVELESAKVQLKEAEGSISKLMDINSRLTKKAADLSESSDQGGEKKDGGSRSRRLVSDRAEKMSEKIGKLELDLQKIQCALQKMEQEHISKKSSRVVEKSGILLKEYIYGKKETRKKKRGCGCMRPKAKGD